MKRIGNRPANRLRLSVACGLGLLLLASALAVQATEDIAAFWSQRDDSSEQQVDHSPWQAILDRYLQTDHPSGVHRFDYASLQENPEDFAALEGYLGQLQALDPRSLSAAEQMAYWINFYNALTVQVVTVAYPVDSIRDIHESWLDFGPWDEVHANVAGQELTLNDIEHRILRPIWKDPRIHYAVNCASYGCPNLAPQAYTAANLEELLEKGARDYVNHPRGVALADGDLLLSSIYDWYQEDFGDSEASLIEHLLKYAEQDLAARLRGFDGGFDYEYDWSLNEP